jgi:uncharacterized protein (UPF0332 family)
LYLKEKYSKEIPPYLLQSLDSFRKEKHETLHGFDFKVDKKDAELIIKDAESFLEIVKKVINK